MARLAKKSTTFQLVGLTKFYKKFNQLDNAYGADGRAMDGDIIDTAKYVRDVIKGEAPVKTGALRDAIIAHEGRLVKDRSTAIVRANYAPSRGPIAPHAHLVERGHIAADGSHTAANPFFRRGVNRSRAWARMRIKKSMQGRLMKAART